MLPANVHHVKHGVLGQDASTVARKFNNELPQYQE